MNRFLQIAIAILSFATTTIHAESWIVASPDTSVEVTVEFINGQPSYEVTREGTPVIHTSKLGVQLSPDFEGNFTLVGTNTATVDTTWEPVWDQFSSIRNYYNEFKLSLKESGSRGRNMNIIFRVYNGGVAFRYEFPDDGSFTMTGDRSQFVLPGDYTTWSYNGENDPIGPVKINSRTSHRPPLVIEQSRQSYIALLEAAIFDFAACTFTIPSQSTVGIALPRSTVSGPIATSWRTILIGSSPGALIESTLLPNLNPPCAIQDPSWVEPGLCLWDWRVWGYKTSDGFTYDLNLTSWLRMIDYATENNFRYLAIDANWYGAESDPNSNPLTYSSDKDVKKAIEYGKERGVELLLYINDVVRKTGRWPLQQVFSEWGKWGAAGVKYGFMDASGQDQVKVTREIIKLCADNKLLVNFHDGPVPPSGDRRTYPNKFGVEYCHAQADAMKDFKPRCVTKALFVNMLAGPLDMGNGWYALNRAKDERVRVFTEIQSTVVSETARIFCTFSGVSMIPDAPEEYAKKADLFDFLKNMPMHWDETRVLNGEIGKVITMARRSGEEWFIGSVINEQGGTIDIDLSMLEAGRRYFTTLYEDAPNSHYINDKESYRVHKDTIVKGDIIEAVLAPGGGHCIWLKPDPETVHIHNNSQQSNHGSIRLHISGMTGTVSLAGSNSTIVSIYTLQGALMKKIPLTTGTTLHWDGTTSNGTPIPNGTYLIRSTGTQQNRCSRVTLCRQ